MVLGAFVCTGWLVRLQWRRRQGVVWAVCVQVGPNKMDARAALLLSLAAGVTALLWLPSATASECGRLFSVPGSCDAPARFGRTRAWKAWETRERTGTAGPACVTEQGRRIGQ